MPVANKPPKAPATATLEAKMAILVARSSGLYQKQRYIMTLSSQQSFSSEKTPNSPRKETSLGKTEKDSHNQQTGICRNGGGADGDDTPRDHDSRDPLARRKVLEEDVAGELHQDVGDEEEGHGDVVFLTGQVELGYDVVLGGVIVECACVTQVDSIEVVLEMSVDAQLSVYRHILSR